MSGRSIYSLVDPTSMELRYVGATRNSLVKRVSQHIAPDKLRRTSTTAKWLRDLVDAGLKPYIMLLDFIAPDGNWREAEKRWIAMMRDDGYDLTNDHEGGTGPEGGWGWSEESCLRLSRAKAGKSQGGTSRFPGVSWRKQNRCWAAQLCKKHLGLFDTEEEAFVAYQRAYQEKYGTPVPGFPPP